MIPHILDEKVEAYLAAMAVEHGLPHPVFDHMHAAAFERTFPIVGPEIGRLFMQLAMMRRPARILELGSGFGYSAIWWALGCPTAEIHLTDNRSANLEQARAFANEAGVADQLHFHVGDALETARALPGPWDIVFCDIDKGEYPAALEFANGVARPGDILIFDNMLWYGKVARPRDWDRETESLVSATRLIYKDAAWAASLLPVRDGVLLAVRKG